MKQTLYRRNSLLSNILLSWRKKNLTEFLSETEDQSDFIINRKSHNKTRKHGTVLIKGLQI